MAAQKDRKALEETGQTSDKIFLLPTSQEARATKVLKMKHKLREPATEIHLVEDLHTTLVRCRLHHSVRKKRSKNL